MVVGVTNHVLQSLQGIVPVLLNIGLIDANTVQDVPDSCLLVQTVNMRIGAAYTELSQSRLTFFEWLSSWLMLLNLISQSLIWKRVTCRDSFYHRSIPSGVLNKLSYYIQD